MRRHLREAARESGDILPGNECLGVMIRRWEKSDGGGVSERYRMHYCRAFKIPLDQFGSAPLPAPSAPDADPVASAQVTRPPGAPAPLPVVGPRAPGSDRSGAGRMPDHRGGEGPGEPGHGPRLSSDALSLAHQVAVTAREGSEHAQRAERRDIGEASLEHLRSEVIRLSRDYMTGEPLPLFFELRGIREQLYCAADRRTWPRDEVELYFLLGCVHCLMADIADDIGSPSAAGELARAGLAYALAIDCRPLIAQLRLSLAAVALWAGQPRRSLDLAASGLRSLAMGPAAAQLHLMTARASAMLGDAETTMANISAAAQLQDADYADDLLQIGGQFGLSRACFRYLAGTAAAGLPGAESEAISHLETALQLYTAGPGAGEDHSKACMMITRIDLAAALANTGDLDAAATTAGPVLALPPGRRISRYPRRLSRLRTEIAAPRYRNAPDARDLDDQIEQYCRDTITTRLHQTASHGFPWPQ